MVFKYTLCIDLGLYVLFRCLTLNSKKKKNVYVSMTQINESYYGKGLVYEY